MNIKPTKTKNSHQSFETQLQNFHNEANNVASYVYADFSINHEASKSKRLLHRLNETPTFWLTTSAALQTAAYISLGRIFDKHKDSRYTIDYLIKSAESNIDLFQREALAKRKRHLDHSLLTRYLDEAYYPNQNDFDLLKKKITTFRSLYEKSFRPARNKYIAHREKQEKEEVAALFGRGKVKDLWKLTTFLLQLHDILWQLYHNGRKPQFFKMPYSISTISRQKKQYSSFAHEHIVEETQKLMKFLKNAKSK